VISEGFLCRRIIPPTVHDNYIRIPSDRAKRGLGGGDGWGAGGTGKGILLVLEFKEKEKEFAVVFGGPGDPHCCEKRAQMKCWEKYTG